MREKVTEYLDKPTKKLYAKLTSMEQKFVDGRADKAKGETHKGEKPKAEKPKAEKPKPENK